MTKKQKLVLYIAVPVMVLLLIIYYLLSSVYVEEEQPLVYPEGNLTDSLFVAQNTDYVENESLTEVHAFETVPYKLDIFPGEGANVEDGMVYRVTDSIYIYVAEFPDNKGLEEVLTNEFPKAILYNYNKEKSSFSNVSNESGYINGFLAYYFVDQFYISDGVNTIMSCMLGYTLDIADEYEGNNLLVAVGTTEETSESFAECKVILDALMMTLRYDENIHQDLVRAAKDEELKKEEEEKERLEELEKLEEGGSVEIVTMPISSTKSATLNPENVTELPVKVRESYQSLTIEISWDTPTFNPVLELFYPGDEVFCEPVSQSDTSATFVLHDVVPATYTLHVLNYMECGNIHMNMQGDAGGTVMGELSEEASEEVTQDNMNSSSTSSITGRMP